MKENNSLFFFPTITKGPGRDLKSLGGKFGVHHYQKIVPQNGQVEGMQIGEIFGQLAQTQSLLHVPFEGALNITRPRSLKRWFSHLLLVMFMWGTFLASARLFFHSNSPPCCFCLDLLRRPLDETNRGVFSKPTKG